MVNVIQTEIREVTVEELRKVTWDYTENEIVGSYLNQIISVFRFEVVNFGNIHPLTIQRCNVAEGWIEHLVCESYPTIQNCSEFFTEAKPIINEDGDFTTAKVYGDVIVRLRDVNDKVILTLSKEQ